jgi:hypothetical protein
MFINRGRIQTAKVFSISLIPIVLVLQAYSNFYQGHWYQPGEPVIFESDRVSKDHRELYRWLAEHRYDHIYTNYWVGYRVAFETGEKIKFTRYGEPRDLRIPSYEKEATDIKLADRLYVVAAKEGVKLEEQLKTQAFVFTKDTASGYTLISSIKPSVQRGEMVTISPEMVSVTDKPEFIPNMLDGNPSTRWGSGRPQAPGMSVEVSFPTATEIAVIGIDYGEFAHDVARGLLISAMDSEGHWTQLFKLENGGWRSNESPEQNQNVSNLRFANLSEFYLNPQKILKLKIEQTGSHPILDWSIAKLELFGAAKPNP